MIPPVKNLVKNLAKNPVSALVKKLHPQGIPWPASVLYNRLSQTRIFREHYRLVAKEVPGKTISPHAGRILDIGTGPGFLLHEMARRIPGAAITGMDISWAMADQARHNLKRAGLGERISLCGGDAAALPFRDGAFGCVVSTGAFHHWQHPEQALEEIFRVICPGGTALIYDLVRHLPAQLRRQIRKNFGAFRLALLWLHSFEEPFRTPGEMTALGAGTRFGPPHTWFTGGLCCLALTKEGHMAPCR